MKNDPFLPYSYQSPMMLRVCKCTCCDEWWVEMSTGGCDLNIETAKKIARWLTDPDRKSSDVIISGNKILIHNGNLHVGCQVIPLGLEVPFAKKLLKMKLP